jgi:glycerol-3-phosphate dehydrogenase
VRERALARLRSEEFDVLVVGGGINGAGIARDLALRAPGALRIALIEQRHFASGTSGRNSQLLHGGLRYLEGLHFGLVREALRERVTLARIAPHLVDPIPFLIPFYGWFRRRYYGAGLWLYDLLAGSANVGRRRFLTRDQAMREEPRLAAEGLHSAGIYWDCRVNAARMVLENIFDAAAHGVVVSNYLRAGRPRAESGAYTVPATDALTGESFPIRARRVVDARGPWDDSGKVRLVRGSHIIVPRVAAGPHAIAHFHTDGRIIFVIPWGPDDSLSLVGTTDVDHAGGPDAVRIAGDEVRYLLAILRGLFPGAPPGEPLAAYSSLRPLVESGGSATSASREHRIFFGEDGVLRITGGKYTTYRAMSEEAVDLLAPELRGRCATASTPLNGNSTNLIEQLRARAGALAERYGVETRAVESLIRTHGLRTEAVLALLPEAGSIDCAVMRHAIANEMALRLPDLLFVSTYWGFERRLDWRAMARQMGALLGWDDRRMEEEAELASRIAAPPD